MNSSYSLERFDDIGIDADLLRNEIKTYQNNLTFNMMMLSEYHQIQQWINDIVSWKFYKLNHSLERSATGIYGELLAAALFVKEEYFRDWIATVAVNGFGNNTNEDIKSDWIDYRFNIEVKTLNKHRTTAIIERKMAKRKQFCYPECLLIVIEIDDNTYQIHSMTPRFILEKIVKIKSTHNSIKYEFNLHDLNKIA